MKPHRILALACAASLALVLQTQAQVDGSFFVAQDSLTTVRFGTFTGQPNPNNGRLLFLYAHRFNTDIFNNHFHAIGAYDIGGTTNSPVIANTNANNRIPETYTGLRPLTLVPGSTNYPGKLVSHRTEDHYSDLTIRSVQSLKRRGGGADTFEYGYGSPQHVLFNSNVAGRTNLLNGAVVAVELVEKSPALHIGSASNPDQLKNPGDRLTLGDGNTFEFTPLVWVDASTPKGNYSYRFKLVDIGSTANGRISIPDSGIVTFDFRVAGDPEVQIAKTVTLTVPLTQEGYALEAAPNVNGPWAAVDTEGIEESTGSSESAVTTGNKLITLPLTGDRQFYRFRKL